MSFLDRVTTGRIEQHLVVCLYGLDGGGKSTVASQAPKPIYICTEDGTANLPVARFPTPKSFQEVMDMLNELLHADHPYQTLVIDSLDWLEPLIFKHVCEQAKVDSIEKVGGGYGIGYAKALKHWGQLIEVLKQLRDK